MLYQITHTTRYVYEAPVSHCLSEVRLTPRALSNQEVRGSAVSVEPTPAFFRSRKDYFGNDVSTFGVFEQHERFTTTAKSIVEVKAASDVVATDISWEESRDAIAAESDESCLEASEYTFDSPYVPTSAELAEYAQKTFAPKRPLIEAVKELSTRIHTEFKYRPASTSIDMPLSRVLRERCGVCQDFAHIMIGAMRSLRLSARYVSGYVRTGAKFQGAQASHAWVSVFIPGHGWQSIDPTNNLMPSDSHVTLAWGRDYGDVAPVKGITLGGGKHTVEVEVYTVPAEGEQPTP